MLLEHFAPLLLALTLVAAGANRGDCGTALIDDHHADGGKQTAERKLRRQDDGEEEHRQDQDDRAGAVQILREQAGQRRAERAAGAEFLAGEVDASERQRHERGRGAEQQPGAECLRIGRVENAAPEVMPADARSDDGREIGGIAYQLKRQLGEEGADAAGEVRRRKVGAGVEEPDRIGRTVADERNQPDHRQREQADAEDFAETARDH